LEARIVVLVVEVRPIDEVGIAVVYVAAVHNVVGYRAVLASHVGVEAPDPAEVVIILVAIRPIALVLKFHDRRALRYGGCLRWNLVPTIPRPRSPTTPRSVQAAGP
jgi:hypothetical protein